MSDRRVVVEPREEAGRVPVLDGARVAVGPDQVRLVHVHELVELCSALDYCENIISTLLTISTYFSQAERRPQTNLRGWVQIGLE